MSLHDRCGGGEVVTVVDVVVSIRHHLHQRQHRHSLLERCEMQHRIFCSSEKARQSFSTSRSKSGSQAHQVQSGQPIVECGRHI